MLTIRRAAERGHYQNSWLNSRHTFSFGEYYDPAHMGVSLLRVINDDRITPGAGFPTHPHRNMEIVTYVLEGELEHKDNMGNGSVIRPGDVQRMSAGTGVTHSEFNPSDKNPGHFLQIWLLPERQDVEPGYEQKFFSRDEKQGRLKLLVSPHGSDSSISANTDARIFASLVRPGDQLEHALQPHRLAYLHVASGSVTVNGIELQAGDGATISAEPAVCISAAEAGEVLLFDLPAVK